MRLVLCLLLTLAAAPAWAAWVAVEYNDKAVYYLDPATIKRDGNLRRFWQIQDLKQRDKDGVMSRRSLAEYDCKEERYRILSGTTHSKRMADGNLLTYDSQTEWGYIAPVTVAQTVMRFVCAK